jgi:hypothetical protein
MKKHSFDQFCMIVLFSYFASAQVPAPPSVFIAGNVGAFVSGVAGFDKVYDSRLAFAFGGSLGVPLSSQLYLFAKFTNFSKSGVSVSSTREYINGQHFTTPQTVTGTMTMRQWLINCGVMSKVLHSKDIAIEIDAGLTYSRFSWAAGAPGSFAPDSPVKNHEVAGLFAGIILEHRFAQSQISTFIDAQYNYFWPVSSPYVANFGAINVSGGVRVYLTSQ